MTCPVPDAVDDRITLAHGEGGRLMRRLIHDRILPLLANEWLAPLSDAAILPRGAGPLAVTTDSYVVSPLFFPGGDIGRLAILGTANDLAVSGATPRWMSMALVIEEGLPWSVLARVLASAAAAAREVGVAVVAGDTKVVPRGGADGLYINTTGWGVVELPAPAGPASLAADDELLVSGEIGRHGMAVLACRTGLALDPPPVSDCGSLLPAVTALRAASIPVRAMRDATRGGVAAVLHEWADTSGLTMTIDEHRVPLTGDVRGACELLGLDPLHVANEGTLVAAVEKGWGHAACQALRQVAGHQGAALIGRVAPADIAPVMVLRALGRAVPLTEPLGAPLPRIC